MQNLDPTYLRYIYDGLIKGSVHPENSSELPDGLIGLYEEAFDERTSVVERQKLLQRFAIWALLKKEVSAAFVAEVLGETEDDIQEFISTYSAWFNSPESGKYQLYHERLKVYLLQKLRDWEIYGLHEKLISRLEQAIEEQKADEFEWYGLEFLAIHVSVSAIIHGDGQKLMNLAYSQTQWQRQFKISKGFNWTKTGLKAVMTWASKYKEDEVIECGLQMIDLHHQEQNAAPHIVALVAEGDFDAALKRIEQFGENDEEGIQRKFILYMLCLMELTLLDSKDKPFSKKGIEKLLKHLDEQLPVDHSILTWNEFFPSYMVFLMVCEWAEFDLDYNIVYKRTDDWESDWLKEKGLYTDIQFDVLLECARGISDYYNKSIALKDIAAELAKQGKTEEAASAIQEARKFARGISDDYNKSNSLKDISTVLAKQGKTEEAGSAMQESLECARVISDDEVKFDALKYISAELTKQGKTDEALESIRGISDDDYKSFALKDISAELAKQGKTKEALECIRGISYDPCKSSALKYLSAELSKQAKTEEAVSALLESLECARGISYDPSKSDELKDISAELAKQGKTEEATSVMQEAIECARGISYDPCKSTALKNISAELAKQGKVQEASSAMGEALKCALSISDDYDKSDELKEISVELAKQGKTQEALESAREISIYAVKCDTLKDISTKLVKQGKTEEALECARVIGNYEAKSTALKVISAELAKQGKTEEAKSAMQETLEYARGISDDYDKSTALNDISAELTKQGKTEEALECALGISDYYNKSIAMYDISAELVKQGKTAEALEYIRGISANDYKSSALKEVSAELAKQGKTEEAASAMQESLECAAQGISYDYTKSSELNNISVELVKQGKIEEALECARGISNDRDKSTSLKDISAELAKQGKSEEAASAMQEALKCARGISLYAGKCDALKDISAELAKQGDLPLAEQIGLEIPFIDNRQNCWKKIANSIKKMHGLHAALEKVQKLENEEASIYYLKGIFNSLTLKECNAEFILSARKFYLKDMVSMEKLFQNYALHELFFQENSGDKIERLNHTLNLQWAIDIKNQLPK